MVFIPRHLSLEKLDLNPAVLKQVSLEQAWEQIVETPTLQGFKELFTPAKKDKLIKITGHGSKGNPAGLSAKDYVEFLKWANNHRCKGLLVSTCHSGGESSLLHLPSPNRQGVNFPVLVGDFITKRLLADGTGSNEFFSKMRELLATPGGLSVPKLRKAVKQAEISDQRKFLNKLLQVYFPPSSDSPGGFRAVGEEDDTLPVTYTLYRQRQIEYGHIAASDEHYFLLYPPLIECPIELGKTLLYSMIPGPSHHLLVKVAVGSDLKNFLQESYDSCRLNGDGHHKTLFIASLLCKDQPYDQFFFNMNTGECGYRIGKEYYLGYEKVSQLRYLLRWAVAVVQTTPADSAVRSATGGQQHVEELLHHLAGETFWGDQYEIYIKYYKLLPAALPIDELTVWMAEREELNSRDVACLIHYYLINRKDEHACALFLSAGLPLDTLGERGISLIQAATENCCYTFLSHILEDSVELLAPQELLDLPDLTATLIRGNTIKITQLIEQGANPFQIDSNGQFPIVEAIKRSPMQLVEDWFALYDKNTKAMGPIERQDLLTQMLIGAINSGEEAKIRLVLAKGATIPALLDVHQPDLLIKGFKNLYLFGKTALIKEIGERFGGGCPIIIEILNGLNISLSKKRDSSQIAESN